MLPEIGLFLLIISSVLAFLQVSLPYVNKDINELLFKKLAIGQALGISISFLVLVYLFVSSDFSVLYVAKNSNVNLDYIYKFCALWGAHEGSILLWLLLLQIWFVITACTKDNNQYCYNSYGFAVINLVF